MASLVQELLIKIGIKSDTAQGKDAAASVERIGNAVKATAPEMQKAGTASKDMAQNMGRGIEVGNATTALMQNLGNASKGGAEGMFAAARATASFAQVVKGIVAGAGPIGLAIAAIGLLGGAVFALKDKFTAPKQSVDEFKSKLADLNKASLTQLYATLGALSDRLKAAKEEADAVRQSMDMIDDAEMGAKLSANKASGLDDKEKQRQEFLIRDEFKARKQAREKEAAELAAAQANETKNALAPEFSDARDRAAAAITAADENDSRARAAKADYDEYVRLRTASGGKGGRDVFEARQKAEESFKGVRSEDETARINAERDAALENFQGKDGSGGISAKYQAAVDAADKSDKALRRLLTTREEVDKWDKARVRLENGGIDPRDAEAAARMSPGKARTIGPDGTVREYDVGAAPTINQGIAAAAEAARSGQLAASPNAIQLGGGKLPGDGRVDGTKIKVDAKPLEKGLKEGNDKTRAAIDAELAKVATSVAAQAVALTTTAAATSTLAAAQAAMQATVAQMQSQISNMRTN